LGIAALIKRSRNCDVVELTKSARRFHQNVNENPWTDNFLKLFKVLADDSDPELRLRACYGIVSMLDSIDVRKRAESIRLIHDQYSQSDPTMDNPLLKERFADLAIELVQKIKKSNIPLGEKA